MCDVHVCVVGDAMKMHNFLAIRIVVVCYFYSFLSSLSVFRFAAHSLLFSLSHSPRNNFKDVRAAKETQFHSSRTNLINEREVYAEDTDQEFEQRKHKITDDIDSMRRHEIDRGSDADYDPQLSLKRQSARDDGQTTNREQYFIKDGNAEILRLITRGKADEENIYVNIPPQQPQYIMVENGGKEILMKRFIDEQANGKHIIREHYQIVPTLQQTKLGDDLPTARNVSEIYIKSQPGSMIYSQAEPNAENKISHTMLTQTAPNLAVPETQMQHAYSNQSLIQQELETSLKQQNALLRQILLEKEKLEEKYSQQEIALETQSLPGHSMAIATQTDCDAGTQTDEVPATKPARRRARSENDDSMSEDEYEYIRYSPPNSPEGVYWIKRKKHRKKSRYRTSSKPRKRVVMVEQIKRKIRTPIKEENEDIATHSPPKTYLETRTSILRRLKNVKSSSKPEKPARSAALKKDILMEITDSFDGGSDYNSSSMSRRRRFQKEQSRNFEYFDDSDEINNLESDNEIVIRRNNYSADSLDDYSDSEEMAHQEKQRNYRNIIFSRQGSSADAKDGHGKDYYDSDGRRVHSQSVTSTPASKRPSRKDAAELEQRRRQTTSEPPRRSTSKPRVAKPAQDHRHHARRIVAQSEADLIHCMRDDGFDVTKNVSAPRYMEWYYNKTKESDLEKKRLDDYRNEKEKSKVSNKKMVGGIEKRIKSKAARTTADLNAKPEPLPRTTPPPKGARMLKEDVKLNKSMSRKTHTDTNHPLLQYSEHRYEHVSFYFLPFCFAVCLHRR